MSECKQFTLEPDVYPIKIHVSFCSNRAKTRKFFNKCVGRELEYEGRENANATFTIIDEHCLFEFIPDLKRSPSQFAGLVAHEAVHATWYIERYLGDMFNFDIQEPQAYLVQYLTQNITFNIWKHLKRKKRK